MLVCLKKNPKKLSRNRMIKLRFPVSFGCVHTATCGILFVWVLQNRYKQHFSSDYKTFKQGNKRFLLKIFHFPAKKKKKEKMCRIL